MQKTNVWKCQSSKMNFLSIRMLLVKQFMESTVILAEFLVLITKAKILKSSEIVNSSLIISHLYLHSDSKQNQKVNSCISCDLCRFRFLNCLVVGQIWAIIFVVASANSFFLICVSVENRVKNPNNSKSVSN